MHLTRAVLTVAGSSLLSGCMAMGGWGHMAGMAGSGMTGHMMGAETVVPPLRCEASSGDLTIVLSLPTPTAAGVVTISAVLRSGGHDGQLADGEIWLRVERPDGHVDRLRMQRDQSFAGGIYETSYGFPMSGLYVVTADARSGTGADLRAVSVTTEVEIGGD